MSKFNRGETVVNKRAVVGVVLGSYRDFDDRIYVVYRAGKEALFTTDERELDYASRAVDFLSETILFGGLGYQSTP